MYEKWYQAATEMEQGKWEMKVGGSQMKVFLHILSLLETDLMLLWSSPSKEISRMLLKIVPSEERKEAATVTHWSVSSLKDVNFCLFRTLVASLHKGSRSSMASKETLRRANREIRWISWDPNCTQGSFCQSCNTGGRCSQKSTCYVNTVKPFHQSLFTYHLYCSYHL